MDYWQEAFGDFNPQVDQDAAVKFALNVIMMDERLRDLSLLLTDARAIGGLEGEPGWMIERRDTGSPVDRPGDTDWPPNASFHVHVDPRAFELAHPDVYMETSEFHNYVRKAMEAFIGSNPSKRGLAQLVTSQLPPGR